MYWYLKHITFIEGLELCGDTDYCAYICVSVKLIALNARHGVTIERDLIFEKTTHFLHKTTKFFFAVVIAVTLCISYVRFCSRFSIHLRIILHRSENWGIFIYYWFNLYVFVYIILYTKRFYHIPRASSLQDQCFRVCLYDVCTLYLYLSGINAQHLFILYNIYDIILHSEICR